MTEKTKKNDRSGEDLRPKSLLRPAILVLLQEEPSHGYELVGRLEELGFGVADFGGLYRTLRTMEEEGLVRSEWGTPERGPARRIYTLTPEGAEYLRTAAAELVSQRRAIGGMLKRYRDVVRTRRRPVRKNRVLVVEDDDDLRHTLWLLLEQRGWIVDEAADGEDALDRISREMPDVVVLDYRLPGISGIDVARNIREEAFDGPAVLYSAYLTVELEDEAAILNLQTLAKTDVTELLEVLDSYREPARSGRR